MHPAFSIVFFTTATGAGYGLLAFLGVLVFLGLCPSDVWFGLAALCLAFGLVVTGLLSSTGHLGRPERAWRAFSQWRTSWLSREGVASMATFVPAGAFALGWIFSGPANLWVILAGLLTAVGAVVTVFTTGMIYASLKPIAQWHNRYTGAGYIIFSLLSGSVLLNMVLQLFGHGSGTVTLLVPTLAIAGWVWKTRAWANNDKLEAEPSRNSATGLKGGRVHSIEWPHTEENYLLKEMGFRIARKHRDRLRLIAQLTAFFLPAVLVPATLVLPWPPTVTFAVTAAFCQFCGMLIERWLFFAEARHTVVLYYGL